MRIAILAAISKSRSWKVNGYVSAILALEAGRRKGDARYDRFVRPLDRKRDELTAEVKARMGALVGTQQANARRILGVIAGASVIKYRTG